MQLKKKVTIIGGGPSALLMAAFLDTKKFDVTIYEKNKTVGRKFLVAGKGGFNITHSESTEQLINRYSPSDFLEEALQNFTNTDFRYWLKKIGIPTYIGSSKRIYPEEGIKPIKVLNAILDYLKEKGITTIYNHTFSDWDADDNPIINEKTIKTDYTVFSLGGASWEVTGSDGNWLQTFSENGVQTSPFEASNCAYEVNWNSDFMKKNEGIPLKNIAISCGNATQKGEVVITLFGLEGNAIYGLSPQIREELNKNSKATIFIDFKPTLSIKNVLSKLKPSTQKNRTAALKKDLKLSAAQIDILKTVLSKESYLNPEVLATAIKNVPLEITAISAIDEAISTVGGIDLEAVSENFELQKMPTQFCIGEMMNWDAPTGGYLLQACASMGVFVAEHLNKIHSTT